jgi:hypothetical protein
MTQSDPGRRPGIFALVRRLVSGGVQLARLEVVHARQEVGQMLGELKGAGILLAIAAGLVLLALIALVDFIIFGVAALLGFLPMWLVALLVALLLLVIAGLLGWIGVRRIKIGPPEETIASVKEDIAWAKRLLRRE